MFVVVSNQMEFAHQIVSQKTEPQAMPMDFITDAVDALYQNSALQVWLFVSFHQYHSSNQWDSP